MLEKMQSSRLLNIQVRKYSNWWNHFGQRGTSQRTCSLTKWIPYDTSTIEIESIDEAIVWIVDNQRGRRNVATEEQRDYISGKRRAAQKNIDLARDRRGVFKSNAPAPDNMVLDKTARKRGASLLKQAREEGCSHIKIDANEKFAKGIDAVKEVAPEGEQVFHSSY